tara:strand:- start:176 stop:673 length:498 start_codon:yes stop_codon:yes gene_type:complete
MSDIFSADGGGDQFLSWNAKDHYFALNKESVDIADLYVDALSFRAGWANLSSDPKHFVFGQALGETIEQPGDTYQNVWYVNAHVPEYGDLRFSWFSWSVVNVFRKLYKQIKDQPEGKLSKLKVTSDLVKDQRGNAGPALEFVGFVDKPGDSAPAPAAAADDDTVF